MNTLIENIPESIDYEIIVLDNNPYEDRYVDRSMYLLGKYCNHDLKRVKVIEGLNYSEIRFRPDLIKSAVGDYVWFIDDDCIIDTYGLRNLVLPDDNIDFFLLDHNQFYMENEIYDKTYSYNLYDIIFKRDLFNYHDFTEIYQDPHAYRIGGDKKLMEFIGFYDDSLSKLTISSRPVIINLYRRNGDNLMLNNHGKF